MPCCPLATRSRSPLHRSIVFLLTFVFSFKFYSRLSAPEIINSLGKRAKLLKAVKKGDTKSEKQLQVLAKNDHKAVWWSLGIYLAVILTGRHPFKVEGNLNFSQDLVLPATLTDPCRLFLKQVCVLCFLSHFLAPTQRPIKATVWTKSSNPKASVLFGLLLGSYQKGKRSYETN